MKPSLLRILTSPSPLLKARYAFTEGAGTTARDSSGAGHHLTFGTGSNALTWTSTGVTTSGGTRYARNTRTMRCSAFSWYAVVKWSATPALSGYAPIVAENNSLLNHMSAAYSGKLYPHVVTNGAGSSRAFGANLNDGNWHILAATWDGSIITQYLDGEEVGCNDPNLNRTFSGSAKSLTWAGLIVSNLNAGSASWPGDIAYVDMYPAFHPAAEVKQRITALGTLMASRGITITALDSFVIFEGDSLTDPFNGIGYPNNWAALAMAAISPVVQHANYAVSGSTMAYLNARAPYVDRVLATSRSRNVLVVFDGANDLNTTTWLSTMKAYCLARRAAGANRIVLAKLLPTTQTNYNTNRNTVNPQIVADPSFYDQLITWDSDPTIGTDAAASDTTEYSDGIHLTIAGHAIAGPYAQTAIQAALA